MNKFNAIKSEVDSTILAALIAILIVVGILALHVFALTILWRWHIVPLGVKEIGPWHALGLMCAVGMFKFKAINKEDDLDGWRWMKFATSTPLILLAIGYLAKEMM